MKIPFPQNFYLFQICGGRQNLFAVIRAIPRKSGYYNIPADVKIESSRAKERKREKPGG